MWAREVAYEEGIPCQTYINKILREAMGRRGAKLAELEERIGQVEAQLAAGVPAVRSPRIGYETKKPKMRKSQKKTGR